MANKIILTTEQHAKLLNHIVSEVVTESKNLQNVDGTINEGVWEKVKYGLSKLGRYKANGKIFGKGKTDSEAAVQIQAIIDKKGNELIKNLDAAIKEKNPQFPNNEEGNLFLNTVMEISGVYDSIIAGVNQQTIPIDAANGIINDLRNYVKKYLDVDLTAAYSVVDEAEGNILELTEDEAFNLDEAWGLGEAKKKPNPNQQELPFNQNNNQSGEPEDISPEIELNPNDTSSREVAVRNDKVIPANSERGVGAVRTNNQVGPVKPETGLEPRTKVNVSGQGTPSQKLGADAEDLEYQDVLNAKDVRAKLQAKRGAGGNDFASTRMDTLKSNKLAMTLVGVGASLGAFSWLVNTDWFKTLFQTITQNPTTEIIKTTVANNTEIVGNIKPGQGLTQLMNAMNHAGITPNTTPEQFLEQVKILGGGDVNAGINALATKGGIFVDPASAKAVLSDIVQNPHGHGNTLGQIFKGKWAGTGRSVGDMLTCRDMGQVKGLIAGTLTKAIPTIVMKSAVKAGAGYAAAKGLGAILGPIGVAAVATGALVKLMRLKGQKQSRAKTLNDLYQSMLNIGGGLGIVKPETPQLANANQNKGELPQGAQPKGELGQGPAQLNAPNKELGQGPAQLNVPNNQIDPSSDVKPNSKETYTGLIELFKYITSTNKKLPKKNVKPSFNVGDFVKYKKNGETVKVTKVPNDKSKIVYIRLGKLNKPVNISDLTPETRVEGGESKFITNDKLVGYLNQTIGNKKLAEFEGFLSNLITVRDNVKNFAPINDKKVNGLVNKMKRNPIMYTNFNKLFDVSHPDFFENVKKEIVDLRDTIYSGNFKSGDMMTDLLRMSQSSIHEGVLDDPKKEAQNRKNFKKYLISFLTDSIKLFQLMITSKKQTSTPVQNKKETAVEPSEVNETVDINPVLTEHINRIKKIMYKVD